MNLTFWTVTIFLVNFISPINSFLSDAPLKIELLGSLIDYNVAEHLFPKSLRFIQFTPKASEEYDWTNDFLPQNEIPLILGNNRPLMPSVDPRQISTGRMIGFYEQYHYVIIIYISDSRFWKQLLTTVKKSVNPRWDRVIFVTHKESLLQQIMSEEVVIGLKDKTGYSLDKPDTIWADPYVYNNGNLMKIPSPLEIPDRNKKMGGNLHGRFLKIAGTEFPPMIYKTADSADGKPTYAGNFVNIHLVASKMFNYTYHLSYDASYGEYWPENSTWTGMYSKVFYPKYGYHMTIGLGIDFVYSYGVDFASMLNTLEIMFVTNHPETKLEWYAFALPYSGVVWLWFFTTYVVFSIVQFFVMYLVHGRKCKYIVWESALFLPYAMATEQGLNNVPRGARYLALIWLMGTLVLGTGYKSTLRNNLSFPQPESIPLNFEQLGKTRYGVTLFALGSVEREYIEGTSMPALVQLRKRIKYTQDVDGCIRNVFKNHHTACIGWSFLIIHQTARSLTVNARVDPLVFSKETPKWVIVSAAFQKDSIFVDSFMGVFQAVFESGLIAKWELEEYYKSKQVGIKRLSQEKNTKLFKLLVKQTKQDDSDRYPLTMSNLWAIFAFLPLGITIAAFLYAGEIYTFNQHMLKNKARKKVRAVTLFVMAATRSNKVVLRT